MSDDFDLRGKVALVTGGSRGLGRAMVLAFAGHGANVVIASRKAAACEAVAEEVRALGQEALAHACHVGHWRELDELAEAAYERFGQVDVLVNNAGMSPLYRSLADVSEELYDKVMDVNLKGPFRLSSVIGARMAAGPGGSIINVSSVNSETPSPDSAVYAAAKSGLNNLTRTLAFAFGPKVRVNCIVAGPFLTDIAKAWDMAALERHARTEMALGRAGAPNEVTGAALYFASAASSFTTGALLRVDGGSR